MIDRHQRALVTMTVLGAFGGTLAHGSPTAFRTLDAVLRAVVGAGFVLAGARARPGARVLGALTVALAAAWGPAGATGSALVSLVLAAGAVVFGKDNPILGGVVGLGVGQAALRLEGPHVVGGTALVALLALTILSLSALRRAPTRIRRPTFVALGTVACGCLLAATAYGIAVISVRSEVREGVTAARRALTASRRGDTAEAAREFGEARLNFARVRDRLDAPWLRAVRVVPIAGRYADALWALSDTGAHLATTGNEVARSTDTNVTLSHGKVSLARVRALKRPLATTSSALAQADRRLAAIDTTWLIAPFRNEIRSLQRRIARARDDAKTGVEAVRILPGLLGSDATRRYFVALQTPAEARANGGIIGNFAVVSFSDGRFDLVRSGRSADLDKGGSGRKMLVAPVDYVHRYARFHPELAWQNVTMSPDFPTVARVVESLYPQSGGTRVDGVVSVDPIALAAILELTGPVRVPELAFPLTSGNAAQVLLRDQYVRFTDITQRTDFLGSAVDAVIHRLKTGALPSPTKIAETLAPVISEGRLKLQSTTPSEQHFFARIGVDGSVPPVGGDFIGVVAQNMGSSKIDVFAHRAVRYDVTIDATTGTATSTATITLRNDAPRSGLPAYVIGGLGPDPTPAGESRVYLSVYSPLRLRRATIAGRVVPMNRAVELGRNVFSTFIDIPSRTTAVVRLDLAGRLDLAPTSSGQRLYRLTVLHQPTIAANPVDVLVKAAPDSILRAESGLVDRRDDLIAHDAHFGTTIYTAIAARS
jgi:hypothetical protein